MNLPAEQLALEHPNLADLATLPTLKARYAGLRIRHAELTKELLALGLQIKRKENHGNPRNLKRPLV